MKIGELAKQANVSIDTVRYYEKQGLLQAAHRSASGYRQYDSHAFKRLSFILKSKTLGFTLKEIHELLDIKVSPDQYECAEVKDLAEAKLRDIEIKMNELKKMHSALSEISSLCCGGREPATACSILDSLSSNSTE